MSDIDERRRITYHSPEFGTMVFIPACEKCGRFVKADDAMRMKVTGDSSAGPQVDPVTPNADCKRCGRVAMLWEGFL